LIQVCQMCCLYMSTHLCAIEMWWVGAVGCVITVYSKHITFQFQVSSYMKIAVCTIVETAHNASF
jgi:hypothetical protein